MSHAADRTMRRRRWPLFLPFILVVLLAVAWTAVWFYAAGRAQEEIAALRVREAKAGRAQDCASQSIAGYPFRIEVRCGGASFELKGNPTLRLSLPSALAAVQVYDPKLLISEFTAPLEISEPGRPPSTIVDWRLGQASVRGLPAGIERASLVLDAASVRDAGGGGDVVFKAGRVELHGRQAGDATPGNPAIETVLRLNGAVADKLHPLAGKPIDAEIATMLRGVDDISPKPWPMRLREWQARDGRPENGRARLAQGGGGRGGGAAALAAAPGRGLDGNLQVTVVGIEKLLKMFEIDRIMSEGQIGATLGALDRLVPGLGGIARQNAAPGLVAALGQRAVLDGKPAVAFPVRFADGTVFLGPFQVGMVPPLF